MPLLDHFHSPIAALRHWESFHAAWATEIMRTLNRQVLPEGCFAEAQVHVGSRVEVDVATFEAGRANGSANGGPVVVEPWAPPAAALVMPAVFPDEIEVQVFHTAGGATLVGAIELISPGNKDRPEARRAFAARSAGYLQQGVGLVIVDIVTRQQANLHDELVRLLGLPDTFTFVPADPAYPVAYRPTRRDSGDQVEVWPAPLAVGDDLPVLPLALRGVATVPVDLDATYAATRRDSRL